MKDYDVEPKPMKVILDLDNTKSWRLYVIKHGEEMPIEEYIKRLVKEALDD